MHVQEMASGPGSRVWCLVLETGDRFPDVLRTFAEERDLTAARFTALGAFREAVLAYFAWESKEYEELPVDEQVEVTSLLGDVGRDGEGVAVHAHAVLGRRDGRAVTGHLVEGTVRPTLELFLEEGEGTLRRRPDRETGLTLIRP